MCVCLRVHAPVPKYQSAQSVWKSPPFYAEEETFIVRSAFRSSTASHGKSIGTEHNKLNNSFLLNYFREREKNYFLVNSSPRFTRTINNHCYLYDKTFIDYREWQQKKDILCGALVIRAHSLAWRRWTQREKESDRERNRLSSSSTIRRYIVEVYTHPRTKPFNFMLSNLLNWLFPWYSLAMLYARGLLETAASLTRQLICAYRTFRCFFAACQT